MTTSTRPPSDRKSTRLNSSHEWISYAVFCLKKKKRAQPGVRSIKQQRRSHGCGDTYRRSSDGCRSLCPEQRRRLPVFFFFFNDTATTEIYTLSLHDALPI